MQFLLFGLGKMGRAVAHVAESRGHAIVSSLEEADVCIDFSASEAVLDHVRKACVANLPIIIGTTGWEANMPAAKKIVEESGNAALYAPNFSIGVALFRKLLQQARRLFKEHETAGIEIHHNKKKDAPSGTAKAIASDLGIPPFSSMRIGTVVGQHEVFFDSPIEMVTIKHEAKNRDGFALGAVKAAEWILDQKGWLTLDDMLYCADNALR